MKLPETISSFSNTGNKGVGKFYVEYDGWHFEGATERSVFNKVLKYIFAQLFRSNKKELREVKYFGRTLVEGSKNYKKYENGDL
jgi:hypothetical protein